MKPWLRILAGAFLCLALQLRLHAQQPPVLSVNVTQIAVSGGSTFTDPNGVNEAFGNVGSQVTITARAVGVPDFNYSFFVNGSPIGTVGPLTGSASIAWTPPQPGTYFITASASDNGGNSATSLAVRYFAVGTSIISPLNGTLVPSGSSVVIQATATPAPSGTNAFVQRMDFYADGSLIGSDNTYPYSIIYTPPAAPATHTIEARAIDNNGNQVSANGTATRTLNMVTAIGTAPQSAISSPANNAAIAVGNDVTVAVDAFSSSGVIAKVELYIDGVLFGTDSAFPYSFTWHPTVVGTYRLVALTYDDKNNVVASTTSTVPTTTPAPTTVLIAAPSTVAITSPTNGGTVNGGVPTQISAIVTDSNGYSIASVQFFVDGTFVGQATTPTSGNTYTITTSLAQRIDPTTGLPAPSIITAVATNSVGLTGSSPSVSVSVTNGGGGGTVIIGSPPTVAVTAPASGAQLAVNTAIPLTATAVDADGNIISVQFFANNQVIAPADTVYPYSATWTPTNLGTYAITAKATDNDGNIVTSAAVPVTVIDVNGTGPTVAITSPLAGATMTVGPTFNIAATATSSGSIAQVQFFVNGVSLAVDRVFPFTVPWTPTSPGTFRLSAIATDDVGNTASATPITVTVNAPTPPAVTLTSPSAGSTSTINVAQTLTATASSGSGTIAQVQFFANGQLIGTDTTFPYSLAWTPTAPGSYVLTAVVTDSFNTTGTSGGVPVTIGTGSSSLPLVTLTGTPTNTAVTLNTPVVLMAAASDADGAIADVSFFVGSQLIGSSSAAPYRALWTPITPGTFNVTAVATDNVGNRATSTAAVITVRNPVGAVPVGALFFNSPAVDTPAAGTNPPAVDPFVPISVSYGSKLIFEAPAVDQDGTIASVQFFVNGASIATVSSAPFFTTYDLNTLSDLVITALITDSSGNVVYTNPILIDTQPSTFGPASVVTLVSPTDGTRFVVGGQILFSATHNFGTVNPPKIDFYVNGGQFTTVTSGVGGSASAPYQATLGLTRPGNYVIHAVARSGTTTTVSAPARIVVTGNNVPAVSITSPGNASTFVVGNSQTIAANATDADGTIQTVQFFVNGTLLSAKSTAPFTAAWSPGVPGTYVLTASATDDAGGQTLSTPVVVTISNNNGPTVSLLSPAAGSTVAAGTGVSLSASAADADGIVTNVRFLANGNTVGNATSAPFAATWTPTAPGTYTLVAQATDNSGNVTTSASRTITVSANQAPAVALTAPANGSSVRVTGSTTLSATASDVDGTIANVQFFANGAAVGTPVTTPASNGSYRVQWTPTAEGVYRLTANATDNAGTTSTSSVVTVIAVSGNSTDAVYTGSYIGNGESGRFTLISIRGRTGVFIAYTNTGTSRVYYFPGLAIDAAGGFSATDTTGRVMLSGSVNDTGASGTFDGGRLTFIGPVIFPSGSSAVPSGYYSGSLTGRPASVLAAIVGADGSIAVYMTDGGSFRDAGAGTVSSTGAFSVSTSGGNRISGAIDPATGFVTGTLTGGPGGAFMGGLASGVAVSDGALRNLSTRGQVGTGANILIAGFVVGGTTSKQVLIRSIGPSLASFGVSGALGDSLLEIYSGSGRIASNDNWGGDATLQNAMAQAGAFPLAPGSFDSALLLNLQPGSYTAQVSGVAGRTGVALVELYDMDNLAPFSGQKVMNVATRGVVGTGGAQLIAGFVITGNLSKKVLVRGVGPSLASVGITSGFLTDPVLRIVRSANGTDTVVRENDNWESGNDAAVLGDASTRVGAFALSSGSRDAAILITLPPGLYTAQLTGAGASTGVGLIEVYEVP